MKLRTRKLIVMALVVASFGALALAFLSARESAVVTPEIMIGALFVSLTSAAIWAAISFIDDHFRALDQLRSDIRMATGSTMTLSSRWGPAPARGGELEDLSGAVAELMKARREETRPGDARLLQVIDALDEGVLMIAPGARGGRISLVNGRARALLGAAAQPGGSVETVLDVNSLADAAENLRRKSGSDGRAQIETVDGRMLSARLVRLVDADGHPAHEDQGLALFLPVEEAGAIALHATAADAMPGAEHMLWLHDEPPPPPVLEPGLLLAGLPVVFVDAQTTGGDLITERIVSIAAIRGMGGRLFPGSVIDRLVNPGILIPPRATRLHGITSGMAAQAEPMPKIWPQIATRLEGCVLIGCGIHRRAEVLRREAERSGTSWQAGQMLDVAVLFALLFRDNPADTEGMSPETMAAALGVEIEGRHTALGDALMSATLFSRLVERLEDRGITTLGQLEDALNAHSPVHDAGGDNISRLN